MHTLRDAPGVPKTIQHFVQSCDDFKVHWKRKTISEEQSFDSSHQCQQTMRHWLKGWLPTTRNLFLHSQFSTMRSDCIIHIKITLLPLTATHSQPSPTNTNRLSPLSTQTQRLEPQQASRMMEEHDTPCGSVPLCGRLLISSSNRQTSMFKLEHKHNGNGWCLEGQRARTHTHTQHTHKAATVIRAFVVWPHTHRLSSGDRLSVKNEQFWFSISANL